MKLTYLIALLAVVCLTSGCGSLGGMKDDTAAALTNTRQATEVIARRVVEADQKIAEATKELARMKESINEKIETVNKSVDKVTSSVDKVADKVVGVTDKVTEKFDKVSERLETKFKEAETELLVRVDKNREELEEKFGPFDADGDGKVSAEEATDAIKKDPTNIWMWIGVIAAFLGIGGKPTVKKISEMVYNTGRTKRIDTEEKSNTS